MTNYSKCGIILYINIKNNALGGIIEMPRFDENTRVKFPATVQFMRLGYTYVSLKTATIDVNTNIFVKEFKESIERINKCTLSMEEVLNLIGEIHTCIKNRDLGKSFYEWLIKPVDRLKLIDFDNVANNDFYVVNELRFGETEKNSFRPDINILINGIPLGFLEVKKPNNEGGIQKEFDRMINKRLKQEEHEKFFNLLQIVSFSNNMPYDDEEEEDDSKQGSFYTTPNGFTTSFNYFREEEDLSSVYKREVSDQEITDLLRDNGYAANELHTPEFQFNLNEDRPTNSFVDSLFLPERLLYLLKYGIAYVTGTATEKHVMRYPQFFATRSITKRLDAGEKSGIIWHTQGSGKTALSCFANRVISDYYTKKGINTRFFFVVDRLDLLTQACNEFEMRGLTVKRVDSKQDFIRELNKTLPSYDSSSNMGEVTVVNIQKFSGDLPVAKNDYNADVKRVIFIDEAHRSYKATGEFFKNLMLVDRGANFIALTGTPLLSKKERSNLKFGDYIHKYFYDKSISDGYTLKIKKEVIETAARTDIKRNLEVEEGTIKKDDIYTSEGYIKSLGNYVENDFKNFRYQNNDQTIGGMIVCASTDQAKKLHEWFESNSQLKTGLVISHNLSEVNKEIQQSFKHELVIDLLVVYQMLTTGYDVKRLKKMYLLRNAKEHNLLQTISRVNRPYKSPNGNVYKYGYIVDFVDIEEEYDRTIKQYLDELEEEMSDEDGKGSLEGLIVGKEEIYNKYVVYQGKVDELVDISNLEKFSVQITRYTKETLYELRKLLERIKQCHTEFCLSNALEYAAQIDIQKIKRLLKELQNRIDFMNLKSSAMSSLAYLSNEEVVEIIYEFFKIKTVIMNLAKLHQEEIIEVIKDIQKEVKKNKNKKDPRLSHLDEELTRVFEKLEIADLSNMDSLNSELRAIYEQIKAINEENERLVAVYGGEYAFVRTFQEYVSSKDDIEHKKFEQCLLIIKDKVDLIQDKNDLILQGKMGFVASIKSQITKELLRSKLYKDLQLKGWLEELLKSVYDNLQFK